MRYLGGKSRISKEISEVINATSRWKDPDSKTNSTNDTITQNRYENFVSLFCGACSVESKISGFKRKILNDSHYYLIEMFKALQQDYQFPSIVSEEEYQYIKKHKEENPALTGFVGFGCSFGGKWFGGYARNGRNDNYARQSLNSLMKDKLGLMDAEFVCKDYRAVEIPEYSVIYCDPPYKNTTGYSRDKFDTNEFWNYVRQLANHGHKVFVSEQTAPDDIKCVWEKPVRRILDSNSNNRFFITEKLFYLE